MNKLSVIVPAYNEEHRISATLKATAAWLASQPFDWELIVVNDGARDNTRGAVAALKSEIPKLVFLDNKENHGKGWAVRQGMLQAGGDVRLFMDADNSTSIDQVLPMLRALSEGYDIVIGSIEIPGAKINEHAQWYRRLLGHWSKYLIRFVTGLWDIHDTQRGFKLFSSEAAKRIFSQARVDRFGFDIEILAAARRLGYKIKEMPVVWNNAGESTVSWKSYFEVLKDLLRVRWFLWSGKYR